MLRVDSGRATRLRVPTPLGLLVVALESGLGQLGAVGRRCGALGAVGRWRSGVVGGGGQEFGSLIGRCGEGGAEGVVGAAGVLGVEGAAAAAVGAFGGGVGRGGVGAVVGVVHGAVAGAGGGDGLRCRVVE